MPDCGSAASGRVSVYPALLESGPGGPEVLIHRNPGRPRPGPSLAPLARQSSPDSLRLSPYQAVTLADILDATGQGKRLAALLRQVAATAEETEAPAAG